MPRIPVNGVELHVEETGSGEAIVFAHEFAGDCRSWAGQVAHFAGRYRCVTYNARGYSPSDVPDDESAYGWETSIDDLRGVMDALDIDRAHIVGLSMGAYTGLMFAQRHPERVTSLVAASGGSGAYKPTRDAFLRDANALADRMLEAGRTDVAGYEAGPARVQLQNKDPAAYETFARGFAEHPAAGSAYTMRRVQAARPSLYDLETSLRAIDRPTLLVVGDEDEPCLDVNLFLKRTMNWAGLAILPKSGHLVNLEEPETFNRLLDEFFVAVEAGEWEPRDPRARISAD